MNKLESIKKCYQKGKEFYTNSFHKKVNDLTINEDEKRPLRYDIINYLLYHLNRETSYLEIGVRNPEDNFNKINATKKYSVDPGIEYASNPVDFPVTSDAFFSGVREGNFLSPDQKFDVIFIDGLHLAEQVDRDIENAIEFIKEDGFIVLHDCNPPTEWHAREAFTYELSPARGAWNGTTWKAFFKARQREELFSCCVDTDWGVGILSKRKISCELPKHKNPFYEFSVFESNRMDALNLMSFEQFVALFD